MIALAPAAALALALAFYPALALDRARRAAILFGLAVPILLLPRIVPPDLRFVRFLVAVNSTFVVLKLHDLHIAAEQHPRPAPSTFLGFLFNPFTLVLRKLHDEPRPSPNVNLMRLAVGVLLLAAGLAAWRRLAAADLAPFALEHCVKVIALLIIIEGGARFLVAAWRLAGGRARDIMGPYSAAPTPAEFWRRYNRVIGQAAWQDIFKPAGGRRSPLSVTLLTFAVSGVVHEYLFAIATGHAQGYQLAFFLLQACAVAATIRARPVGWRVVPCVAATMMFNFASSVLFFASWDSVMPFYSDR